MNIDLNCDLGEGFGVYASPINEDELMRYVTSVNIACGFHAGDAATMRAAVRLAIKHKCAIGAHPGLPDLVGFGRREMKISSDEARDYVLYQLGALYAVAKSEGAKVHHVKPHGALYNQAARDLQLARAIAGAIKNFDDQLILYVPSHSASEQAARELNVKFAREAFADRNYNADGSLVSRTEPDALITDAAHAAMRAVELVKNKTVTAQDASLIKLEVETMCIHGDTPHAVEIARCVRERLEREGITIAPCDTHQPFHL